MNRNGEFDTGTAVGRNGIPVSRGFDGGGLPTSETGTAASGVAGNGNV